MRKLILFMTLIISVSAFSQRAAFWKNGIRLGTQTQPVSPFDGQIWFDGTDLFLYDSTTMMWEDITGGGSSVTAGVGITDVAGVFNIGSTLTTGESVSFNSNTGSSFGGTVTGGGTFGIYEQNGSGIELTNSRLLLEGDQTQIASINGDLTLESGSAIRIGSSTLGLEYITIAGFGVEPGIILKSAGDFTIPIKIRPQNDLATGQLNYVLTKIVDDGTVGWQPSSGGATNLTYTESATNGTVNSDTGTNAIIPLGDETNAGLVKFEEGVFTPTIVDVGSGATYTPASVSGNYYKIGKRVYVEVFIGNINTTGTPSGDLRITGMPFAITGNPAGNISIAQGISENFYSISVVGSSLGVSLRTQNALDGTYNTTLNSVTLTSAVINFQLTYLTN